MIEKEVNEKLKSLLMKYDDGDRLAEHIFDWCETIEERQRMIEFIESKNPIYGKICECSAVIAIEAGRAEGELEECDDDYWE